MSKIITPIRISIAVSVALSIIAIALMGALIHLKTTEPSGPEALNESTIYDKYRFLFRTPDEHRAFENQIHRSLVLHACCNSTVRYKTPNSAVTIYNTNVTVIQNINYKNDRINQYFPEDTCIQESPFGTCLCSCTCIKEEAYFSALVRYFPPINTTNISLIRLDAFCKCVNGQP